jgi:hypothetical protein
MRTAALLVVLLAGSAARADEFAANAHAVPSYPAEL